MNIDRFSRWCSGPPPILLPPGAHIICSGFPGYTSPWRRTEKLFKLHKHNVAGAPPAAGDGWGPHTGTRGWDSSRRPIDCHHFAPFAGPMEGGGERRPLGQQLNATLTNGRDGDKVTRCLPPLSSTSATGRFATSTRGGGRSQERPKAPSEC